MADIVITTKGTLGDHFPFFELGRELMRRGHRVRMGINRAMQAQAGLFGLECFDAGPTMGREEAVEGAVSWNHWTPPDPGGADTPLEFGDQYRGLFRACEEADLLISSGNAEMGTVAEAITGIPRISICVAAALVCCPVGSRTDGGSEDETVSGWWEYWDRYEDRFFAGLRALCGEYDIPEVMYSMSWWEEHHLSKDMLLAASPHFVKPTGLYAGAPACGFIFVEDSHWSHWQPTPELERFMETDPSPLVLSFSSLPVQDPRRVVEIHARAAQKLGRRLLIQEGWAGFEREHIPRDVKEGTILLAGFIPHDWLFSRAAAIICHGGLGTIARALRNGCPLLVEPFGNDQFFNAKRVLELSVGSAMHPFTCTADGLARVLEEKVLTTRYKENAEILKTRIRGENSLEAACDYVDQMTRS